MEWQPIETIPKDGQEVLVTFGHQGWVNHLIRYNKIYGCWLCKGEAYIGLENNATHWCPLPEPPK